MRFLACSAAAILLTASLVDGKVVARQGSSSTAADTSVPTESGSGTETAMPTETGSSMGSTETGSSAAAETGTGTSTETPMTSAEIEAALKELKWEAGSVIPASTWSNYTVTAEDVAMYPKLVNFEGELSGADTSDVTFDENGVFTYAGGEPGGQYIEYSCGKEKGSYVAYFEYEGATVGEAGIVWALPDQSYLWVWSDDNGSKGVNSNDGYTELTFPCGTAEVPPAATGTASSAGSETAMPTDTTSGTEATETTSGTEAATSMGSEMATATSAGTATPATETAAATSA